MSIIHHRDIANAIKRALAGTPGGWIVNISDEASMSIHERLRLMGAKMESSSELLANPLYLHVDGLPGCPGEFFGAFYLKKAFCALNASSNDR